MRHVQRLGNQGRSRTVAGALALVSGLALFSVAHAPGALGQLASVNVGNSGSANASTGGNSATGNSSTNTIDSSSSTSGGLLGGLVDADVGLGSPTNTSTGSATVNSGPASASGNQSQTSVGQTNSTGTTSTFVPFNPFATNTGNNQSATVDNAGSAAASTGGNTATGNNSENTIESTQSAGLIDANVGLGAPTNTSSGTAAITTGPAGAVGNTASTGVNQARTTDAGGGSGLGAGGGGLGAGGFALNGGPVPIFHPTPFHPGVFPGTVTGFGSSFDPCSGRFFPFSPFLNDPSGQRVTVDNSGEATASTGGNTAIGNNSTNSAVINQTASGGLIGLNVNLGSPTNNSTGTATINTGAANASGNTSSTTVNQFCGEAGGGSGGGNVIAQPFARNVVTGQAIIVPVIPKAVVVSPAVATLARTGFESGMIVLAVALVLFGMGMLYTARRRLLPAGRFAGAVSSAEWDSIVRY